MSKRFDKRNTIKTIDKFFERSCQPHPLLPGVPTIVKLEGKNFKTLTQGMQKPYDPNFAMLMSHCAKELIINPGLKDISFCYTRSDEVIAVLKKSSNLFSKDPILISSFISSVLSGIFTKLLPKYFPDLENTTVAFTATIWTVPTHTEVTNYIVGRRKLTAESSFEDLVYTQFSAEDLKNKKHDAVNEMLLEKDITFDSFPVAFREGVIVKKRKTVNKFTERELELLPITHHARQRPYVKFDHWEGYEVDLQTEVQRANLESLLFE